MSTTTETTQQPAPTATPPPPPRARRPRPQVMKVTPAAAERVKALIESRGKPTAGIRIGVRSKGARSFVHARIRRCSAADGRGRRHQRRQAPDRPKAALFLIGTEMDYAEEKLKSGFVFTNPNEKGRCGLRRILPRLKTGHGSFCAAGIAGGARAGARVAR